MQNRIAPLINISFKEADTDSLKYEHNKMFIYNDCPLKCLKIIDSRFKVYVDYGFKGNSRGSDKSDYYVYDIEKEVILAPTYNDFGSIVASLEKIAELEKPFEEKIAPFISDTKTLVLTMQNLTSDGWEFTQNEDGDILANNTDFQEHKKFSDDAKLKKWILLKAEEY
ncbi:hypothetical protein CN918_28960 [Priestia megaterium]|nr:hypothetical protein CN918_28960 [Priestia megaterium]